MSPGIWFREDILCTLTSLAASGVPAHGDNYAQALLHVACAFGVQREFVAECRNLRNLASGVSLSRSEALTVAACDPEARVVRSL